MPRIKGKIKCYVISSEGSEYTYGAFPFSKDGLKSARAHLAKLAEKTKDKFHIEEA